MTRQGTNAPGPRGSRNRSRRASRRAVSVERFSRLVLYLPVATEARPPLPGKVKAAAWLALLAALMAGGIALARWSAPSPVVKAPEAELYVFEELPPPPPEPEPTPPDPAPAPPEPEPVPEEPPPPPQFGLQSEALSEAGELSVATGNTVMTHADTVVKAPVAALPAAPQMIDQPPRILKGRPPEYPARALERGLEGSVTVLATLDTLGRVVSAEVEKSAGRHFDPDVVRAVRSLVFQPTIREGRRVPVRVRLPYEFRLE